MSRTIKILSLSAGFFGAIFPFTLFVVGQFVWGVYPVPTISDYYHSDLQWLFIGGLLAMAIAFMFLSPIILASKKVGLIFFALAIGTAFFPTPKCYPDANGGFRGKIGFGDWTEFTGLVHFFSAVSLIGLFAVTVTFYMTRRDPQLSGWNVYFRTSGICILGSLIVGIILAFHKNTVCYAHQNFNGPIFWFEAAPITIFSIAWVVHTLSWQKTVGAES